MPGTKETLIVFFNVVQSEAFLQLTLVRKSQQIALVVSLSMFKLSSISNFVLRQKDTNRKAYHVYKL